MHNQLLLCKVVLEYFIKSCSNLYRINKVTGIVILTLPYLIVIICKYKLVCTLFFSKYKVTVYLILKSNCSCIVGSIYSVWLVVHIPVDVAMVIDEDLICVMVLPKESFIILRICIFRNSGITAIKLNCSIVPYLAFFISSNVFIHYSLYEDNIRAVYLVK